MPFKLNCGIVLHGINENFFFLIRKTFKFGMYNEWIA